MLAVAGICGLALFAWPFLGLGLPASAPAAAVVLGSVVVLAAVEAGARRLDARRLSLLATIAALDAALRLVTVTGIAGFSPIFFLVMCAGYVFGPSYGFLCGAASLLVSAVVTGGIGPWLPYETLGVAWVGMLAGLAGRGRAGRPTRRDLWALAAVGAVLGYLYGAVLDVWDWTVFRGADGLGWSPGLPAGESLHRFGDFYLATSLVYDSFRAAGNALMVLALGAPVMLAMRRFQLRFDVEIDDAVPAAATAPEPA